MLCRAQVTNFFLFLFSFVFFSYIFILFLLVCLSDVSPDSLLRLERDTASLGALLKGGISRDLNKIRYFIYEYKLSGNITQCPQCPLCVIKCLHDWIFKKSSTLFVVVCWIVSHSLFPPHLHPSLLISRWTVDDVLFCLLLCDCFSDLTHSARDEIGSPAATAARVVVLYDDEVSRWTC